VTTYHGNAREFLQRDCQNIANFFASQGVDVTADDLYEFVTADGTTKTTGTTETTPRT